MRNNRPTQSSGTRAPGPAGTARTNMSAMALLRTQPTAAIPESTALFHFPTACPRHNISTSTSARTRDAQPWPSRPNRTAAGRLLVRTSIAARPRHSRPPFSPALPSLPSHFVELSAHPLGDHGRSAACSWSPRLARPHHCCLRLFRTPTQPSLCPSPAIAAAAEAAPIDPPKPAPRPFSSFPSRDPPPRSVMPRTHAAYPRHVPPPPWAPPDPQTRHVPRGHVPYHVPSHVAILNTALHASPHHALPHSHAFPHVHTHSPMRIHTNFTRSRSR